MINITIFSKNRSSQLDLFLRSIKQFTDIKSANILYTVTSESFQKGYDLLKNKYKNFNFILQSNNFKSDVLKLINPVLKYTTFFVDDNIFVSEFKLENELPKLTDNVATISPRIHKNLNYCYTANVKMITPQIINNRYVWYKILNNGDYDYPMSLDGNIFLTSDILPLLERLNYRSPNTLEGNLSINPIKKDYVICYDQPVLINVPANKVQVDNTNRNMNQSPEEMNSKFLRKYRIYLDDIVNQKDNFKSCHVELEYKWIK
jgi:hypothetical protein